MSKLTKSLSELDAMADELLSKSQQVDEPEKVEDVEAEEKLNKSETPDDDKKEDLKPEDVSENVPEEVVQNAEDAEDSQDAEDGQATKSEDAEPEDVKKSLGEDVEDDKENPEAEKEEVKEDAGDDSVEALEKSIYNAFESNDDIKKSLDASVFLSAVTEVISKSLADVVYNLQNSSQQSSDSNDVLAKSLQASLKVSQGMRAELDEVKSQNADLQKSITEGFAGIQQFISEQLEQFSHQPATMRKSIGNVSVQDRNFQKSLYGQAGEQQLSKSEVLAKLNTLMYTGNPLVQPSDIISYESGAPLRPEVAQLIQNNM